MCGKPNRECPPADSAAAGRSATSGFPHTTCICTHHIRWYNWARTFSPLSQEAAVPFIDFADVKARVSIEEAAEKIGLNPQAIRWQAPLAEKTKIAMPADYIDS